MRKKNVIELIGEENWDDFCEWIKGQTVGVYSDGKYNYYSNDVQAFIEKLQSGYDRQEDTMGWD